MNEALQKADRVLQLKQTIETAVDELNQIFGINVSVGKKEKRNPKSCPYRKMAEKTRKGRSKKNIERIDSFDPANPPRSSCCDARTVTKDGHLECSMCGCECEADGQNTERMKKKERRTFETKPCCGSNGPRHKKGCDGRLPPEE